MITLHGKTDERQAARLETVISENRLITLPSVSVR